MRFKNITKKNIIIPQNGVKRVIKPKQVVDGDKKILSQYSGLLKINQVGRNFNEISTETPIKEFPLIEIEEIIIDDRVTTSLIKVPEIIIEEIMIDDISNSNLRNVSDISIDFIIVDNIT